MFPMLPWPMMPFFHDHPDDSGSEEEEEEDPLVEFTNMMQNIRENNCDVTDICVFGGEYIEEITDDVWEELGRGIAVNSYLQEVRYEGALDDHNMFHLFSGLTRSNTIREMELSANEFGEDGVRAMVPFLRNASKLTSLKVNDNHIHSEGFNLLWGALRDSPIESLSCDECGIDSIEIDDNRVPKSLVRLSLDKNGLNSDSCRELAKLLKGGDSTLKTLWLNHNRIDDKGVVILTNALQNNTSLENLYLRSNELISDKGKALLLKLVNDVSSIKATLQSNHTLLYLTVGDYSSTVQQHISEATRINRNKLSPEAAGKEKVIQTQLHSVIRKAIANLEGINRSVYGEIDPLHLPEILSLIGRTHDQDELYVALKTSVMGLFSTVNKKKCIQQQREYYLAKIAEYRTKVEELNAELATMEEMGEKQIEEEDAETRRNKRRRTWWWGLWGGE